MPLPPELASWRTAQREWLRARRAATTAEQRRAWSAAITASLLQGFVPLAIPALSFYWPFAGEFDPRFAVRQWRLRGARVALPVVLQKGAPMEFRQWWPGVPTRAGVFGLPVPQGTERLAPDAALIPPLGFDAQGYRLGYGGGYFDRTLAALSPQPLKIAVAFESARMASIRPQPHDVPMDFVVTQAGIHHVGDAGLERVADVGQVRALAQAILARRAPAQRQPG